MWAFITLVLDEFPMQCESGVLLVVGSEPGFDLAFRGGFVYSSEDMLDPFLVAV
jgi:hypothetical protein